MEKLKFVAVTIALWVIAVLVTFDPTGNDYLERGIKVEATISKIIPKIRHGSDYNCTYINDKGEQVTAFLILNESGGELGQVVEGYYLPEDPNTVWTEPGGGFMLVFTLIVDGLAILMTVLLIYSFVSSRKKDEPNMPPAYARSENESYAEASVSNSQTNPWGVGQSMTWDEKQEEKEKAEEWSGNQEIKNNESSTGLKLKL